MAPMHLQLALNGSPLTPKAPKGSLIRDCHLSIWKSSRWLQSLVRSRIVPGLPGDPEIRTSGLRVITWARMSPPPFSCILCHARRKRCLPNDKAEEARATVKSQPARASLTKPLLLTGCRCYWLICSLTARSLLVSQAPSGALLDLPDAPV